jgi:hypothetical protein
MFCIFKDFQKSVKKKENENRDNILQKIRIYTSFQKNASKVRRIPKCFVSSRVFKKVFQKRKMKIATTFCKKLEFTPLFKKTHPKFEEFLNVLFQKRKMKIATTFCKKLEFSPFSKKTHPKFKEFLNVLYLEGFFKKRKMKIATTFCKKLEFSPFSKKTHPKFKEFLNVLYLQGFSKKC